jgi:hypothetical protein
MTTRLAQLLSEAPDKLAALIADEEGFGVPGAIPTQRHNPGDLRHSNHSSHDGEGSNDIGIIDSDQDGWADLERQLELYAARSMTLRAAIYQFAPPSENDSEAYLNFVCQGLGVSPDTPVSEALKIPSTTTGVNS